MTYLFQVEEQEHMYREGVRGVASVDGIESTQKDVTVRITKEIIEGWDRVASYPGCELTPWQNNIRKQWRERHGF